MRRRGRQRAAGCAGCPAWCRRPAAHSSHLLVSRGLSPPLLARVPQGLSQLRVPTSQMWGNRGPERGRCLPTSCPAPNPISSHPGLCLLLCVLRPAAHPLWAKVSPEALRMPRLVGLGCQGGSKEITGAQAASWGCEFPPSVSSLPGPGRASGLPQAWPWLGSPPLSACPNPQSWCQAGEAPVPARRSQRLEVP